MLLRAIHPIPASFLCLPVCTYCQQAAQKRHGSRFLPGTPALDRLTGPFACLHELQPLERQLPEHVGVAVEQHVPEVVHLAATRDDVRQLLVVDKPVSVYARAFACVCVNAVCDW